jgi:hypothetical protein
MTGGYSGMILVTMEGKERRHRKGIPAPGKKMT